MRNCAQLIFVRQKMREFAPTRKLALETLVIAEAVIVNIYIHSLVYICIQYILHTMYNVYTYKDDPLNEATS